MSFVIKPAVREKVGLLFGIAGASGSGKTFSALMLAKGLANGTGKVAVVDTEAGRALHYAPPPGAKADHTKGTFDFLHLDFGPPFAPARYIDAIRACEDAGATVIVIDSMSHEWAGEGGCADIQAAEAERMATDREGKLQAWKIEAMTAPAWKRPKLLHQRMMARLIQCRTHLIFCLRAQEKIKIVKKQPPDKGAEIVSIGFQPISEKSFPYELTGSVLLHPETPGHTRYDMPHKLNEDLRAIFREGVPIGIEHGKRLRAWAETGVDRGAADRVAEGVRDLIERIQDAATMEELRGLTSDAAVMKQRAFLAKSRPEDAARVDAAVNDALALLSVDDGVAGEDAA